jgi:hypothetical protein
MWWLPITPTYADEPGDLIRDIDPNFAFYFDHVDKWSFYWTGQVFSGREERRRSYVHTLGLEAHDMQLSLSPVAQTRFHRAIAIVANIILKNPTHNPVGSSSNIIWLPPTTRLSHSDAVDLILRERYGVSSEKIAPDWVASYRLPRQLPIENKISEHEREIERLEGELVAAREKLIEETRYQRLLYERGEPLEVVVRDALRELGAEVEEFTEEGLEDGRLVSPTGGEEGMLEIKGRTGTLKLSDVRQLDQWVRDALFNEEWEGKGILVANMYFDSPLEKRGNPFPDNCVKLAKRSGYCLIKTSQIFGALLDHQRGELDTEKFWEVIFDTDGVCPLPDLEAESQGG